MAALEAQLANKARARAINFAKISAPEAPVDFKRGVAAAAPIFYQRRRGRPPVRAKLVSFSLYNCSFLPLKARRAAGLLAFREIVCAPLGACKAGDNPPATSCADSPPCNSSVFGRCERLSRRKRRQPASPCFERATPRHVAAFGGNAPAAGRFKGPGMTLLQFEAPRSEHPVRSDREAGRAPRPMALRPR